MNTRITFHGLEPSEALSERIAQRTRELERFAPHVVSCHVSVQAATGRHQRGNLYSVHVHLGVRGGEIAASRDPGRNHAHEDAYVALRDAFDAVTRQLEDYLRRRRGEVKNHDGEPRSDLP